MHRPGFAQLFRQIVGEPNYREFLTQQFDTRRRPDIGPTPSHEALVALELRLLFTTNFDPLLEDTYRAARVFLSASCGREPGVRLQATQAES
jgi:hypothetical protein